MDSKETNTCKIPVPAVDVLGDQRWMSMVSAGFINFQICNTNEIVNRDRSRDNWHDNLLKRVSTLEDYEI